MKQNYNWQRLWYQAGEIPPLDKNGYLNEFKIKETNELVSTLSSISYKGCLILLGEPGIGKSDTLKRAYESEHSRIKGTEDDVRFIDLRDVANRDDFNDELFDRAFFKQWVEGAHTLYLFVDSFDESLMQFENLVDYLGKQLDLISPHVHRLKLRLACRSGIWIDDLGEKLKTMWSEEQFSTYHLAPLCKQNIVDVLESNGIEPHGFLEEAESKGIVSFLVKPVTLFFILEGYDETEMSLPESQIEIYQQGCRLYCNEVNLSRKRKRNNAGRHNEEKKFRIASQLAVMTILANRSSINNKITLRRKMTSELDIKDIRAAFPLIADDELLETLQTGLFNSIDAERFRWTHLTFAEYLTASYLNSYTTVKQILDLLSHSDYPGKLAPQFHATAAWLAGMNPEIFDFILKQDYDVLFLCDFSNICADRRRSFIKAFLDNANDYYYYSAYIDYRIFSSLNYPGLEEDIRQFIFELNNRERAVILAIEIATQCGLTGLHDDYLHIFEFTQYNVQAKAIYAFMRNASFEEFWKLKHLALTKHFSDAHLFRSVIENLVKCGILQTNELLLLLSHRTQLDATFIKDTIKELMNNLELSTTLEALDWAIKQYVIFKPEKNEVSFSLISDLLLLYSSQSLFNWDIKYKWYQLLYIHYEERLSFKDLMSSFQDKENDNLRRQMLQNIICEKKVLSVVELKEIKNVIFIDRDEIWLKDCIQSNRPFKIKTRFQWLFRSFTKKEKSSRTSMNRTGWKQNAEKLKPLAISLDIESPLFVRKWIEFTCDCFDLDLELFDCKSEVYRYLCNDSSIETSLIRAAEAYLLMNVLSKDEWSVSSEEKEISAGRTAFQILYEYSHERLKALPISIWSMWMPIIIEPRIYVWGVSDIERDIKRFATENYPLLATEAFIYMINQKKNLSHFPSNFCYDFWNKELGAAMLDWVKLNDLTIKRTDIILSILFDRQYLPAEKYAKSLLKLPLPIEKEARDRSIITTCILMTHAKDAGWDTVWDCLNIDIQFGNEVMRLFASSWRDNLYLDDFVNNKELSPEKLGDFLLWIHNSIQLPIGDRKFNSNSIEEWNESVFRRLEEIGTERSFCEIRRIADLLPELKEAKESWNYVKNDYLRMTWKPHPPKVIGDMVRNKNSRLVENAEQLINLIIESLQRFEDKLQGITPSARMMWDKQVDGSFKHVDENDFSNFVKQHLYDDLCGRGIIVNREIEIRRGYGQGKGQRPDIIIDAVKQPDEDGHYDPISIIIEVKGCWHHKVDYAMQEQLIEQYLQDNHLCTHGLYVVGWFYCPQWKLSKESLQDARNKFNIQAEQLSVNYKTNVKAYVLNASLRL
ncbi:NACHT domain-containing protein [Paenibacillus sp. FSL P2-0173]|uniref:NACHT domain-containing protein n=1 Tax=Paenibacillus sp. FSL P2-0173 TaxID=2921627 RepID=UPI0030F71D00